MFTLEQLRQPKRMRARTYHLFSADVNIVWSFRVSESKQPQRKLKPRHCSDWYIPSMEATYPIPVKLLLMYESDVFTINIVHTQRVSDSRLVVKFVCYRSDWKSWSFVQDMAWSTPCYLLLSGCQISKKKAWRNRSSDAFPRLCTGTCTYTCTLLRIWFLCARKNRLHASTAQGSVLTLLTFFELIFWRQQQANPTAAGFRAVPKFIV